MIKWFFRAILLLSLGITAHDIAVIYGFHIPGLHAWFFAVPIALICAFVLLLVRGDKRV